MKKFIIISFTERDFVVRIGFKHCGDKSLVKLECNASCLIVAFK